MQIRYCRAARHLTLICAVFSAACHRTFREPASVIGMGDPGATNQLISGFYSSEGTGWRWTAKRFSVILRPPADASRGTILNLTLFIPQTQIDALGPMTLKAAVGKCSLAPQTFSKSGTYSYTRDVPGQEAISNILPVTFSFDRANTHAGGDNRELAAIVRSIGVQSK